MPESCYLCGVTDRPLTADHVIPKVLFPQPRPHNLITERACEACNGGLSKDDALFAVYVSAALGRNEAGKWVWDNKATKSILAKSVPLAKQFLNDASKKEILTEVGIVEADVLKIPQERLERVIFRMAKGLLRHIDPTFDYSYSNFKLDRLWPTMETAEMIKDNRSEEP